ncbi:hypothetical protein POUND7_003236 [Theobroma cacao]
MAISDSDQESSKDYNEGFEEEDYSSYHGSDPDYDSGADRSYSIEEETRAKLQNFSIKKKSRAGVAKDFDLSIKKDPEEMEMNFPEVDDKSYEYVQKIVKAGKLEKLKVDQCKVYLKKYGLRLSGRKDMLIQRIKEHLEILNGGGEKKYPLSSFILNCKGDACTGDVVMFEQNVYEMFNIASRSASGPPCGTRIVAGRIVKESYGAAKQQHTFTIEVLWSKGEKPLPPLHPLLIKGRNLYRLKTLRQKWEDEGERQKALMEKHSRGSLARSDREVRILEKERREMLRANRIFKKDERNKTQSQLTSTTIEIRPQQLGSSSYSGIVAPQHQQSGLNVVAEKLTSQTHGSGSVFDLEKPPIMSQQSGFLAEPQQLANQSKQSGLSVTPREKRIQLPEQSGFSPNFKAKSFQSEYKNVHVLQQLANQPKQSGLSVAPREKRIQLPEQSGFSPNFKARSFQSEYKNVHVWEGYQNQIPRYSVQSSGIPEVQLQKGDKFHIDCRKTNFHMNKYQNSINDKSRRSGMSKLLETSYHRHQLKSMNNCHPETPPQRRGFLSQQPCRYHAQGRCYYGENCKFLHETRELHGAEERRFWRKMAAEPVNVNEFRELARRALPKMYYDFYSGGAEDQHTLKENEEAFGKIIILPRILRDVSGIDLSTTVLGYNISMPVMIAPTGMHKLANPAGEIATAKAASACKTIMVYKRRDISAKLVQRAENNGYKAIVLTADSPRLGRREADIKNKLVVPQPKNLEGLLSTKSVSDGGSGLEALARGTLDPSFCWEDIRWLKSITNLPILIKGVLTHEDAIKALEVGVAGIIVSNHGARQLDYSPATISVLEEVVHAVGGKVPVFLDGGVRRGTDIFKAVALGAQAVLVGRPVLYGLAAKGEYGVRQVLEMLMDELEITMALSGCSSVKEITRSHVRTKHEQLLSML